MTTRPFVLLLALATAGLAAEPRLIPYPQSVTAAEGHLPVAGKLSVRLTRDTPGARFALESLWQRLQKAAPDTHATVVVAGVRGDAGLEALTGQRRYKATLGRPEGYVLEVAPGRVLLAGADEAGLFYGLRTIVQLLEPAGLRQARIEDWPALRHRGLTVDISRGPVLTEEQMRTLVRTLADFKMNMLSFYMEHVFPYRHAPGVAPDSGLTAERFTRLAAYARQYHVDLVPQQQTFGHLHHMLKLELYAGMAETPYGNVLAAENEDGYRWIDGVAKQLTATFSSPYLHIGSDETFELGEGASKALTDRVGVGEAYMMHMRRVSAMLRPLGKKLMFWGDIALNHPDLIDKLPKDLVAVTWNYDAKPDFRGFIEPFRKAGMEVFVSPGINNWGRLFPDTARALTNIDNFTRDGKRLGAVGMFNTHWNDAGDAFFNANWYAVVFSAAASWQDGPVDLARFRAAWEPAFYRSNSGVLTTAIERFEKMQTLLPQSYRAYWADAFSRNGARTLEAPPDAVVELRKLAEQNLIDLEGAEKHAAQHADTILYLRLASRQMDYVGMKIAFVRLMGRKYREAFAAQADRRKASQALGILAPRAADLLVALNDIHKEFREAWLRENSPYWLANVDTRYAAEALGWQLKMRQVRDIQADFQAGQPLPPPEQLGFFLE